MTCTRNFFRIFLDITIFIALVNIMFTVLVNIMFIALGNIPFVKSYFVNLQSEIYKVKFTK